MNNSFTEVRRLTTCCTNRVENQPRKFSQFHWLCLLVGDGSGATCPVKVIVWRPHCMRVDCPTRKIHWSLTKYTTLWCHFPSVARGSKESSRANDARGRNWLGHTDIVDVYVYKSVCVQTGTHIAAGYLFRCLVGTSSTRFDQAGSNSLRLSCFRSVTVAYTGGDGVCERTEFSPEIWVGTGGHSTKFWYIYLEIIVGLPRMLYYLQYIQ